ncbi:MAG TPA: pyridoxal phosphate-dependent aminotransferase [Polyangiaceae bacterium]|nr:pyridoxal phosphate-dependent aminotransferase [Polyangiaceae bacterium]
MVPPINYLRWATRHYGRVSYDLGRSGVYGRDRPALGVPSDLESFEHWDELRARIARYNGVADDEALPVLGASHGLYIAYATLLSPGDEVLIERVTYEPMHRIAEGIGANVATFERSAACRFALDPAAVARSITDRTRVIAVTNLHNPGGVRADEAALHEVARLAAATGAHVLVDEVYAPFGSLCDARAVWGKSARNLAPNVVAVGSLTKCYGLGAHRVGWVLGPRDVIARAEDALVASLGHAPVPWMAFGLRAFDRLPAFAEWSRATMAGKSRRVEAWFASRPHFAWSTAREGLFGFAVDLRAQDDLTPRIEQGVRDHGVIVAPGAFFGVPNAFRLAWSIEDDKLDEALVRLGRIVD